MDGDSSREIRSPRVSSRSADRREASIVIESVPEAALKKIRSGAAAAPETVGPKDGHQPRVANDQQPAAKVQRTRESSQDATTKGGFATVSRAMRICSEPGEAAKRHESVCSSLLGRVPPPDAIFAGAHAWDRGAASAAVPRIPAQVPLRTCLRAPGPIRKLPASSTQHVSTPRPDASVSATCASMGGDFGSGRARDAIRRVAAADDAGPESDSEQQQSTPDETVPPPERGCSPVAIEPYGRLIASPRLAVPLER
jgi:hypothetical protein